MRHFPLVDLFMLNDWFPTYTPDDPPAEIETEESREATLRELGVL